MKKRLRIIPQYLGISYSHVTSGKETSRKTVRSEDTRSLVALNNLNCILTDERKENPTESEFPEQVFPFCQF